MECCFFKSCILNDTEFLNKYKKKFTNLDGKLTKKIFVINKKDELITSLNISSDLKKNYIFCDEHLNQLKELLKIKNEIFSNPDKIPKDILISLNNILKNNIDIKQLLYKMEFNKGANIIKILLNNINMTKDKDIKLYLYLILRQFLEEKIDILLDKENLKDKFDELKHRDKEIFEILYKEIFMIKLKVYDLNKNQINAQINDENLIIGIKIMIYLIRNK